MGSTLHMRGEGGHQRRRRCECSRLERRRTAARAIRRSKVERPSAEEGASIITVDVVFDVSSLKTRARVKSLFTSPGERAGHRGSA